jgi:glycosyltransferase involved in cell wall biosynthesis
MKKITFLVNSLSAGGAEKVLSVLANELVKNYDVEIIFLEKNEFYKLDKNIKKTYLSNFNGKENVIKKFLYLPILAWKLKKYVKKNKIKLIQSHVYRANYVNILSKIFGSAHKTQIVIPGIVSFYQNEGLLGKINLFLIKNLFPLADLIIWKSKRMKIDANNLFNFKNEQQVIYNPIDIDKIHFLIKENIGEFKFKKDKFYLVSVGRLIKLKRNKDLIESLKYLDNNVEVLFIGDGEEKENLIDYAKKLGLEKRIHFIGKVNNPFKYLKYCNIFVHTSKTEGFPNVLVEALSCGLPVISSDCISGPREILAPDTDISKQLKKGDKIEIAKYGILYPVGDVEQMVNAIKLLLQDEKLFNSYKEKVVKRAKDFSMEKIIKQYKKVLLKEDY